MNEVSSEIEQLETPIYKLIFYFSISCLLIFLGLYFFSFDRNQFLEKNYPEIQKSGKKAFGTILDNYVKNENRIFIYTYILTDEVGERYELNEQVDEKTHLKLRVGNTIVVRYYKTKYFREEKILARIEGNRNPFPNSLFLIEFSKFGILFSVFSFLICIFFFIVKRK